MRYEIGREKTLVHSLKLKPDGSVSLFSLSWECVHWMIHIFTALHMCVSANGQKYTGSIGFGVTNRFYK